MKANTARKYTRLMANKYPAFVWEAIRRNVNDWVVSGSDGISTKHYDLLDCVVSL